MTVQEQLDACFAFVKERISFQPEIALVLGSGLGGARLRAKPCSAPSRAACTYMQKKSLLQQSPEQELLCFYLTRSVPLCA